MLKPLPYDGTVFPYFTALGLLTHTWALAEFTLETMNALIFQVGGGNTIETELPVSIGRKIRFFRLSMEQLPLFTSLADEGKELATRYSDLKEERHDYVHGIADLKEDEFSFDLVRTIKPIILGPMKRRRSDPAQIVAIANKKAQVGLDAARFGRLRLCPCLPHGSNEAAREIPG